MYSVVIFHRENTVEGVPSIWLKILAGKHYCSWPIEKCKVRQYIKSYIKPSRKWDLIPCSVKRVVEKYEDLSAACEEVRYLTATEEEQSDLENSDVPESDVPDSDEQMEDLPQPPKKLKTSHSKFSASLKI